MPVLLAQESPPRKRVAGSLYLDNNTPKSYCLPRARYPSGKGEVCKTFMRRFESDPRLQNFLVPGTSLLSSNGALGRGLGSNQRLRETGEGWNAEQSQDSDSSPAQ